MTTREGSDEPCKIAAGIERAKDEGRAVGENPAVAGGGGSGGSTDSGNRRNDQEATMTDGIAQLIWYGFPQRTGENKDDRHPAAKKELEHVLFQRTLESADDDVSVSRIFSAHS